MATLKPLRKGPVVAVVGFMGMFLVALFYICYTSPLPFRSVAFVIQTTTGYRVNDVPFYLYLADDHPKGVVPAPHHVVEALQSTNAELSSITLDVPALTSISEDGPTPIVYSKGGRHFMQLSEDVTKTALGEHAVRLLQRSQVDLRHVMLDVTSFSGHHFSRSVSYKLISWFIVSREWSDLRLIQAGIRHSEANIDPTESRSFLVLHPRSVQATSRYSAKSHMVCPPQVLVEYPLAFIAVVHLGLDAYLSPGFVSMLHLVCAILAGICFVRSVKVVPVRRSAYDAAEGDTLVPITPMSPTGLTDWDGRGPNVEADVSRRTVSRRWMLQGCLLFWLRNWLDLVDGVLARYQKLAAGPTDKKGGGVQFGFNGHTMDVVTDGLGCTLACLGMFYAVCQLKYTLPTSWFATFYRLPLPQIVFQKVMSLGKLRVSQVVVFIGLAIPAAAAGVWEVFMMRYSSLLDPAAMYSPSLFELEHSLPIRICWFLWSLCSGDTWIVCFNICVLLGGYKLLWNFSIFAALVGYLWVFFFGLWSEYVWSTVVLHDLAVADLGA